MKTRTLIGLSAAALALGIGIFAFNARSQDRGFGPPFMHRPGGFMDHRMDGGTDMVAMSADAATNEQLRVIHTLFINHDRIKRTVTNLPDGIRTVTEPDDPQIAALLKPHVAHMMNRSGTA